MLIIVLHCAQCKDNGMHVPLLEEVTVSGPQDEREHFDSDEQVHTPPLAHLGSLC